MMRVSLALSALLGIALLMAPAANAAGLCTKWSDGEKIGAIDSKTLKEASGIAFSRAFKDRAYHNQDSGDGPNFYITDMKGANTQTVAVKGFTPSDVEDIALGACGKKTCLYLGDIGDNAEARKTVQIVIVPEKAKYKSLEKPLRIITAKYPDKAHNAEGFAIHPNGDLFVITKSFDQANRRALVAQVFKLTAAQLAKPNGVETFAQVGTIDLPYLLYDYGLRGQIVTGMDISDDGKSVLIVTYQNAVEMALDLSKAPFSSERTWKPGADYRITPIQKQPQTEAIAYTPDGKSFVYDSETVQDGAESLLYQSTCVAP
jgi:hypothetical protein